MPQMTRTAATDDFGTTRPQFVVRPLEHGKAIDRFEITGPTCAGIEFARRTEQPISAANACVGALAFVIVIPIRKRTLGARLAEDVVLFFGQKFLPLRFGPLEIGHGNR